MKTKRTFVNNVERFEMYENNELSEEEVKDLENDLVIHLDLKLEYRIYKETNNFLERKNSVLKKNFPDSKLN